MLFAADADKTFGKTIFGKSWVASIEEAYNLEKTILSRLASIIALTVKEIQIEKNIIKAKIKDENNEIYETELKIKPASDADIDILVKTLQDNPADALCLDFGILNNDFAFKLQENGFSLFPKLPEEIEIDCPCRSEKQPCNHIASIHYEISKELDKSPLTALTLRSISIEEVLERTGIRYNVTEKNLAKNLKADISCKEIIKGLPELHLSYKNQEPGEMFAHLPTNPIFFDRSDFKSKLKNIYELVATETESVFISNNALSIRNTDFHFNYNENNELKCFITPSNNFLFYLKSKGSRLKTDLQLMDIPDESEAGFKKKEGICADIETVIDFFLDSPHIIDYQNLSLTSVFLGIMTQIAIKAVKAGLFMPDVQICDNGKTFSIRYIPLLNDEELLHDIEASKDFLPRNILFKDKEIVDESSIYDILSLFITHIIRKISFLKGSKIKPNHITPLLTKSGNHHSIKDGNKNVAKSLSFWLEMINVKYSEFLPVVRININNGKLGLNVDIIKNGHPEEILFSLNNLFANPEMAEQKQRILVHLFMASAYMPELIELINTKGIRELEISHKELLELITKKAAFLATMGISVILPKEIRTASSVKLAIKAKTKKNKETNLTEIFAVKNNSTFNVNDLLDFSYEVAIGDQNVSKEEFEKLVKNADGLINFNGQYFILKPEEINSIIKNLSKQTPDKISSDDLLRSMLSGSFDELEFDIDEAMKKAVDDFIKVEDILPPKSLKGTLRPYQERGFKWLYSNIMRGFGSCLADDMGLGKTIQAISLILKLKEENKLTKPILVVCPTTLVGNWHKECEKFAPCLNVSIYHGLERTLDVDNFDIVITTYGLLRSEQELFRKTQWQLVIVDEAQNIKNPDTAQTKAVKSIPAECYIAMTGTPVENRLTELWSIFDFVNSGYLGTINHFQRSYANMIEKLKDQSRVRKLNMATAPFILRRLKSDKTVICDLPEKNVIDEYCYLAKEQAALYESVLNATLKEIDTSFGISRKGNILKLITQLKQICNHPAHFMKGGEIGRDLSGKTEKAVSILENILEQGEKALIFTQYREMGDLLQKIIRTELNEEADFFHGAITRQKREEMVEKFQTDPAAKFLIISLKAGGTGLNLTAANNIIHYDLWWNPAVEDQATDRAYRIGQTQNVNVHRLVTIGTFEEKIDEMIKSKKELADLTITAGEKWITELSTRELKEIFSLSSR